MAVTARISWVAAVSTNEHNVVVFIGVQIFLTLF
jgi:hypothetical protein